ncbi:MAG: HTH domain-containing protein [Planctomycetaceae bacterium]
MKRSDKTRPPRTEDAYSKFRTRWRHVLHIDQRIRDNDAPNCMQLAGELEVSRRTILRDIDFMKYDLGAPLDYDAARRGYVYGEPNWIMPTSESARASFSPCSSPKRPWPPTTERCGPTCSAACSAA